jgi:3D (Asp-Asp-Asp) domain-containing protein
MSKPTTGRRWRVVSSGYFGTPKASKASTAALRRKYSMEGGPTTAVGDRVSVGDIAVPSNIPLGSKFFVPGYGWGVAKDHGGAIKGNRIDLAFGGVDPSGTKHNPEAEQKANNWGKKSHTVYVFPSSFQIPSDHSPPQAYKNDLANKGKMPVTVARASLTSRNKPQTQSEPDDWRTKTQSELEAWRNKVIPTTVTGSTKTITNKKEGIAVRDAILKDSKKGPFIPTVKGASEDSKAWFEHTNSYNWDDPVHGQKDPNKFLGWSELGSLAYKQKIDKILNSDGSPEQKIGSIQQVKDGIAYQLNKNRMIFKDGTSASDYGDTKIESLQKELTGGKTKIEPAVQEHDWITTRSKKPEINPASTAQRLAPVASGSTAQPRKSTAVIPQAGSVGPVREPSIGIRAPKLSGSIVKEPAVNATVNSAKAPVAPPAKQSVQTSMPALSQQVRTGVTSSVPKAPVKSNADPKLKGPTGQVVIDRTKKPINVATSGTKSLAPAIDEPLPSIDPVATVAPKVSSPESQQLHPNTVLTNYVKRTNTIDSLVDPSQFLQRKKMFLKEQAAIKDVNNDLSIGDRKRLLDTLGAYPEDNRKPQTLGGVVRAGNNAAKGESRK